MEWIDELSGGGVAVLVLAAGVLGALVRHLWGRFRQRPIELRYQVTHNSLVINTGSDVGWGELKATWQGKEIPNLYLAHCTIENDSNLDLEDIEINLRYDSAAPWILQHKGMLEGAFDPLSLTDGFLAHLKRFQELSAGEKDPDTAVYLRTRRDFVVPVFNRGAKIWITFLVSIEGANVANLNVTCIKSRVRMTEKPLREEWFGVSRDTAAMIGFVIGLLGTLAVIAAGSSPLLAGLLGFLMGSAVVVEGWAAIRTWRGFLKLFG